MCDANALFAQSTTQFVGEVHVWIQQVTAANVGSLGDVERRCQRRKAFAAHARMPGTARGVWAIYGRLHDKDLRVAAA
jgi:hypothetical protein